MNLLVIESILDLVMRALIFSAVCSFRRLWLNCEALLFDRSHVFSVRDRLPGRSLSALDRALARVLKVYDGFPEQAGL